MSLAMVFLLIASASAADSDANGTQTIETAGTYSGLAGEIGCGGNVTLKHDYYAYDSGETIEITVNDSVIDGGGAVYLSYEVSANCTIENCSFINCSDWYGNALYAGNVRVINSGFSNPEEDAVYSGSDVPFDIDVYDDYYIYGERNFFGLLAASDLENEISVEIDDKAYGLDGPRDSMDPYLWVFAGDFRKNGYYLWFDDLKPGTHQVSVSYPGDSKYLPGAFSWTITVHGLTDASNLKATYADGSYYRITVHDDKANIASGVQVIVTLNGKKFKTLRTDSDGVAGFRVTQAPGTYKVQATALGNSITKTLTVKHLLSLKKVTVKKSAKKLVLTATLGKINGKYLKNKKITFKFKGKKYTAKTNKKGVAKVTVKSSVLKKLKAGKKVTCEAAYLKDTVKRTVKVKK